MTARTKTLALLAAGTTAVGGGLGAAGATASPTDAAPAKGDGAQAQKTHHGKALRTLARALDVRPGELRDALGEASDEAGEAGLATFAAELGTTPEKVTAAVAEAKDALTGTPDSGTPPTPGAPGTPTTPEQPTTPTTPGDAERPAPVSPEQKLEAFVAALAGELGVEPAKLTEAGKAAKKAAEQALVATLADELDRTAADVREALAELRDGGPKPGVPGGQTPAPGGSSTTPEQPTPAPTV